MTTVFIAISYVLFVAYNLITMLTFKMIPITLSETFYMYKERIKFGYVFTLMLFGCALTLMPACLQITETLTTWSKYLTALPFFGIAAICFVGAAPAFKDNYLEGKVHVIAAGVSAFFCLAWCFVVCYQFAWIWFIVALILVVISAFLTASYKVSYLYWLEMLAFLTTYNTALYASLQ